ncbi:MAG: hypothetical protein ACE5MI_12820 [Acidimicrobiia bacterium]
MYRTSGIIVLIAGIALTYSLVFTTFNKPVERWVVDELGGLEQVSIECPSPWGLIVGDAERDVERPAEAQQCVRSARTLFLEGVIVFTFALGLGIWGLLRGRKPRPQSMRVLPSASRTGDED